MSSTESANLGGANTREQRIEKLRLKVDYFAWTRVIQKLDANCSVLPEIEHMTSENVDFYYEVYITGGGAIGRPEDRQRLNEVRASLRDRNISDDELGKLEKDYSELIEVTQADVSAKAQEFKDKFALLQTLIRSNPPPPPPPPLNHVNHAGSVMDVDMTDVGSPPESPRAESSIQGARRG